MTKENISKAMIVCVALGIWVVGFIDGARFLWWENVLGLEVITFTIFRSINPR